MKKIAYIFISIFLLAACVKEEIDFNKISAEVDVSPSVVVPLAYGTVTLDDFLPEADDDLYIVTDPNDNNLLHLKYNTVLDSFSIDDFLDQLPSQDTTVSYSFGGAIPGGNSDYDFPTLPFNQSVPIVAEQSLYYTIKPSEGDLLLIDSVRVKKGKVIVSVKADFNASGSYTIEMPTVRKFTPGVGYQSLVVTFDANNIADAPDKVIDLTDYMIGSTTSSGEPNKLEIIYKLNLVSNGDEVFDGDAISIEVTTEDLIFNEVYGYIGQYVYDIDMDTLDLNLNDNLISGDLYFAEPKISLLIDNAFGLPMRTTLSPEMKAIIYDAPDIPFVVSTPSNPKDIDFPKLDQVGETISDAIVIDNNTSNLPEILSALPDQLTFGGKFEINPDNDLSIYNFIEKNSYLKASLEVDLPVNLELANFVFTDTLDMDLYDAITDLDDVTLLELDASFENGLPLELKVQAYFYEQKSPTDESMALLPTDSLMINGNNFLIQSAATSDGLVSSTTTSYQNVSFTGDRLDKIKNTKYMVMKFYLETNNPGSNGLHNPVKILSTNTFGFKIGAKASASLNN